MKKCLFLTTVLLCFASTVYAQARHGIAGEDLSICNPRLLSTSQTHTILTTLYASAGGSGTPDCDTGDHVLLLNPGTWTITGNHTIPSRFSVMVPHGAIFSISGGVTLTLECGKIMAGQYPIFTGAGTVACSGLLPPELNVRWFGATPNDATNDRAAFQAAVDVACNASGGVVLIPDGQYHLESELTMCPGLTIRGMGADATIVNVVGAVRGLRYAPVSLTEARIRIENFRLIGTNASALDLISLENAANVWIENMHIRNTNQDCIDLNNVHTYGIRNNRIEDCTVYALRLTNNAQPGIVHSNDFNANTVGTAHIFLNSGWASIKGNNLEGASIVGNGIILNSAADAVIESNFIELYTGSPIIAQTVLSLGVRIANNHINGANSVSIDFAPGSLAHEDVVIERNRFAGNAVAGTIFADGASVSYRYCNNSVENAVTAHVQGYHANLDCVELRTGKTALQAGGLAFDDQAGTYRFEGAIHLGIDANYSIIRSADQLDITAGEAGDDIDLRPGANDTVRFDAAGGITFQAGSTFTSGTLPALADGSMVYCSDCSPSSATCAGSSTGAIAKRLNGSWDCR